MSMRRDSGMLTVDLPPYNELLWPAMVAVRDRGGSVSIDEMVRAVIASESLTEAQQALLHGDGPETEIGYRLAWARTYLKGMGLLTNSRRGVCVIIRTGIRRLQAPASPPLTACFAVAASTIARARRRSVGHSGR